MGWLSRLRNHARRAALDREIEEELRFHVEARRRDLEAQGLSPDAACREAARRFGNRLSLSERVRDTDLITGIENLWQDLTGGVRAFLRDRALTVVAVVSIAIGTGANVAIFSAADVLLLRKLPVPRPDDLVAVGSTLRTPGPDNMAASYQDYLDIRARTRALDGPMAYRYEFVAFSRSATDSARVRIASFVTDNFFGVLGLPMQHGRAFTTAEVSASNPRAVVILTDALWRSEFQADPGVVGTDMRIAGQLFAIVGVAAPEFKGLHQFVRESLLVPVGMLPRIVDVLRPDLLEARDVRAFNLKGRLSPGATLAGARAELDTIGRDLEREHPDTNANQPVVAKTEFQFRYGQSRLVSSMLVLTTILSAAVLCVACANVASLLAGRAPARAREMALRLAVGAGRVRLVRQLMTESLALALAGGVAGLVVAHVGIGLIRGVQMASEIVAAPDFQIDERALAFSLAVALATAFLAGLAPALQATRVDLVKTLKAGDRASANEARRGRVALVAVQLALSVVLVTISAYAFRFFQAEVSAGPGFRTSHIAKLTVDASQARYAPAEAGVFFDRVLERVRALPSVRTASVASHMPLSSNGRSAVVPAERPLLPGDAPIRARVNSIDAQYFETLDIRIIAGRGFGDVDDERAQPVVIVNDTLASRLWPGRNPLGQRLRLLDDQEAVLEVVGVAATTVYHILGEAPDDALYFPYRQRPRGMMVVLAHTAGDAAPLVEPIRQIVSELDRDVPIWDADTIERWYAVGMTGTILAVVRLIGALGLMGLLLSSVGLYGLVSYGVSRRTREFGIRIAIGATAARIIAMVLRQGMRPAWMGLAAGLLLSLGATRLLFALVPVRTSIDPQLYLILIPLLVAVTITAALVPARRAARIDPVVALRSE